MNAEIGIIGGSGLYDMAELTHRQEVSLATPFGDPSGHYVLGTLRGRKVAFLPRHGVGHRISPSELNFRANIFGMKKLGVQHILSASAVGSLKEELKPLDIVVPDQFIDRTRGAHQHVLRRGIVVHVGFAHPDLPDAGGRGRRRREDGRCDRARGRHLRLHGRPAVLDAGRIAPVSLVGRRHHRHDQPAGSQARPRGRNLLHDHRARHRLRLLASGSRRRHRRHGDRDAARRTRRPRSSSSPRPCSTCRRRGRAAARTR